MASRRQGLWPGPLISCDTANLSDGSSANASSLSSHPDTGFAVRGPNVAATLVPVFSPIGPYCALISVRSAGFARHEITAYVLAGLPSQGWQEVAASIRFAADLGVRVALAEYSPVPGTALWTASVRSSRYPLEEPLAHNNSILPLQWEGFTPADLQHLKNLARATRRRPDSGR